MKTIQCQNRKAFSLGLQEIGLITGAIIATAVIAVFGGEILSSGTTVSAVTLTGAQVYADQGYVTVQVKNAGTTALTNVNAGILVDTVASNCSPGTNNFALTTPSNASISPGDSVTFTGAVVCGTDELDSRENYLIQVIGTAEVANDVSETISIQSR